MTNMRIMGCEFPQQNSAIQQKTVQTNMEKYGAKYAFRTESSIEKATMSKKNIAWNRI